MNAVAQRLFDAAREELGRSLTALCGEVGAAETSVLLPRGKGELWFFASSNPALLAAGAPAVPVNASFSGLAFRTGQTIAFADAAGQEAHNKAVDEHLGMRTREFAAIPIHGQAVVGVLTLVNRPPGAARRPFDVPELRRAAALALDMAHPVAVLASLADGGATDGADGPDPSLAADLAALTGPEQRIVHDLVGSLLQNRGG